MNKEMATTRRRGTAIVETPKGILLASGKDKYFLLPGGGAAKWESRRRAAIRELKEETGLKKCSCMYLFTYHEPKYTHKRKKRKIRNLHKVFLIEAEGTPKPNHHDVHFIKFWKPSSKIKMSTTTQKIIEKYRKENF